MNNEWYSRVPFLSSLLASLLLILFAPRMETCLFGNVSEISVLSQIMLVSLSNKWIICFDAIYGLFAAILILVIYGNIEKILSRSRNKINKL